MKEQKNIEIVSGNGSNLNISPVYNHINSAVPKSSSNKPKNIVVPKELKEKNKKEKKDTNDNK